MELILSLLEKNIPLLVFMILWFVLARTAKIELKTIAKLLMYFAMPLIVFDGISKVQLSLTTLSIPLLIFLIACLLCGLGYLIWGWLFPDTRKNLLALSAGKGNYLYFGMPLVIALVGDVVGIPLLILMSMWFILFEATLGMFVTARGHFTPKQSILKVLQIPYIYAFLLGVLANVLHWKLWPMYTDFVGYSKGFLIVWWNMLVGIALAQVKQWNVDRKFTSMTFLLKFLVWPLIAFLIVYFDMRYFHVYSSLIHQILLIVSLVPLSANSIAIASELGLETQHIALAIALSTFFAIVYIPLVIWFLPLG